MNDLRVANIITIALAVGAAAVTYGVTQANITSLEKRADDQGADIRQNASKLADHDKEIGVITQRLDDIQQTVHDIDERVQGK